MSIATELTRIQTAKANIKTAIESKGVTVPSGLTIDNYPQMIDEIPSIDPSDYYTKSETSGATEISNALDLKTDSTAFTAHTANTTVHVTSADKTKWNTVDNKQDVSGMTQYLPLSAGSNKSLTGDLYSTGNVYLTNGGYDGKKRFMIKRGGNGANMDVGWRYDEREGSGAFFRNVDYGGQEGCFGLYARNSTQNCELIGKPDGTLTWGGNISWTSDSHGIYFFNNCGIEKWNGYAPALVAEGDSTTFLIRNGVNRAENYKILHEGNIQPYLSKRSVNEKNKAYVLELKNAYHAGDTEGLVGSGLKLALGANGEDGKYCGIMAEAASSWENHLNMLFFVKNSGDSNEVEVMRITHDKSVGIGIISPQYKLHVNGAVGATAFTNTSDIRNKDVISDVSMDINDIANAPLFRFKWKEGEDKDVHVGSSAQYWKDVLPENVTAANDEQGTLSMQSGVIALASTITTAKEVVSDKEKIQQLEDRIRQLEERLSALETQLTN